MTLTRIAVALVLIAPLAGCSLLGLGGVKVDPQVAAQTVADGLACSAQVNALAEAAKTQVPACLAVAKDVKGLGN